MTHPMYHKLQEVLDTLPNGFPAAESGVELRILEWIFTPEEAELFCDLRLTFESADQIAKRTGRPLEGLEKMLFTMWDKGQIFGIDYHGFRIFRMAPWVFGIFEFQRKRMTREFAQLCKDYEVAYGRQFFETQPPLMKIVPIEEEIPSDQMSMPYEQVSAIIEAGQSFAVADCICKKEHELLDAPCTKPVEVCLSIAPVPGFFENHPMELRPIDKEEAYAILKKSEKAGLVHMTNNFAKGHYYICNCCSCCCGVLRSITEHGIRNAVSTNFFALIDAESCIDCGICQKKRCPVAAIAKTEDAYHVNPDLCIGCGLCVSTCPSRSITLKRRPESAIVEPPENEADWYRQRATMRGVDYSRFA